MGRGRASGRGGGRPRPAGATELARSRVCTQAFRLGETAWAIQFHPEVSLAQVEGWLDDPGDESVDVEALRKETREKIERWNELGRELCTAFCELAERERGRAAA